MSSIRSRTPSEVKWLANELAGTKGELERIDEELARLRSRRRHLKKVHASLSAVSALAQASGLDAGVPAVRAHPSRGGRGAIVDFFRETLRAAYPGVLDTRRMTELTIEHFRLQFPLPQQRNRFRKATVSHTLQRLVYAGEIERLHDLKTMPNSPGLWRWKVEQPSISDLVAAARRSGGEVAWP